MTWGQGIQAITQDRIQRFLWYELPLKWITSLDDKLDMAASLARALDLLGLPRYAAICRSPDTTAILEAYERDSDEGLAAFRRANAASGIHPPDLPELQWGASMGSSESAAFTSVAEFLELAVVGADLVPGARGWKSRQQDLVRTHLGTPIEGLGAETLLHAILAERLRRWVDGGRSETRRKLLASIANRLLYPVALPPGTTDPLPPLRWLLEQLADGVPLTQTGNLGQKFVQGAASRFGWDVGSLPRSEDELYELHLARHFAQRLGLGRRSGRKLVLTARGRQVLSDPEQLWRCTAGGLLGKDPFAALAGELCLALLVDVESMPRSAIRPTVLAAAGEVGFRDSRTGDPPDDRAADWAIHETLNLCRALGLLSVGGGWLDREYGLTPVGKATALEALRARATRPRSSPWD